MILGGQCRKRSHRTFKRQWTNTPVMAVILDVNSSKDLCATTHPIDDLT